MAMLWSTKSENKLSPYIAYSPDICFHGTSLTQGTTDFKERSNQTDFDYSRTLWVEVNSSAESHGWAWKQEYELQLESVLDQISSDLADLLMLEENWDDCGSKAADPEAINTTRAWLAILEASCVLASSCGRPAMSLTPSGYVTLDWSIPQSGRLSVVVRRGSATASIVIINGIDIQVTQKRISNVGELKSLVIGLFLN